MSSARPLSRATALSIYGAAVVSSWISEKLEVRIIPEASFRARLDRL